MDRRDLLKRLGAVGLAIPVGLAMERTLVPQLADARAPAVSSIRAFGSRDGAMLIGLSLIGADGQVLTQALAAAPIRGPLSIRLTYMDDIRGFGGRTIAESPVAVLENNAFPSFSPHEASD